MSNDAVKSKVVYKAVKRFDGKLRSGVVYNSYNEVIYTPGISASGSYPLFAFDNERDGERFAYTLGLELWLANAINIRSLPFFCIPAPYVVMNNDFEWSLKRFWESGELSVGKGIFLLRGTIICDSIMLLEKVYEP